MARDDRNAAVGFDEADLEVLRRLPSLLLREGYIDAHVTLGLADLWPRDRDAVLACLPPPLATLIDLLALGNPVERAELTNVLADHEIAALRRLGILVARADRLHTAGLLAVPLAGQLLLVPQPADGAPYFGDDTVALAARLTPAPGARCLDLHAGPGALSVTLGVRGGSVLAVESNTVAVACIELNATLNRVDDRIEIREGELAPDERFDFLAAQPPLVPFPSASGMPVSDGMRALWRVLDLVPRHLERGGLAQIVGSAAGDDGGPAIREPLARWAVEHDVQIAMSVPSRVRMRPGDPMFELLARTGWPGLAPSEARQRLLARLGAERVDSLFRFFLAIQPGGPRPGLHVAMQG